MQFDECIVSDATCDSRRDQSSIARRVAADRLFTTQCTWAADLRHFAMEIEQQDAGVVDNDCHVTSQVAGVDAFLRWHDVARSEPRWGVAPRGNQKYRACHETDGCDLRRRL